MSVNYIINEDPNMRTRLRVKEEYKSILLSDSGLRWSVIDQLIESIYWNAGGYGHRWQDSDGYEEVSYGFSQVIIDTIIDNGKQELYSELPNPPQDIKKFNNQYFEIEYLN